MVTVKSRIHPAVIVAFELENQGPAGKGPRQPVRQLYRLASAGGEGHSLGARDHGLDTLRHADLERVLRSETIGLLGPGAHRFDHLGMAIPQDVRSPSELIIDVFVAVHIEEARAVTARVVKLHRGSGPDRAADSAGERLDRPLV